VKDFAHKRDETAVVLGVENTSRLFGSYRAGPQDACIALVLCVVKEKRSRFPLFEGQCEREVGGVPSQGREEGTLATTVNTIVKCDRAD
jgi:hypothetical protein